MSQPVGVIVCKQSMHKDLANRGYIAMLSVRKEWRNRGIDGDINSLVRTFVFLPASALVRSVIASMKEDGADEIVLETEYDNHAALSLYESLGFIREKRLYRFYLNGKDAFRLVLVLPPQSDNSSEDTGVHGSESISSRSSRSRRPRRHPLYRAIQVSPYSDEEDN
ncbi:hypothetical protein AX15_006734 [Amanita polypyramis BW_CC]|nr:hypothetical protein AX15_006734 [Amanita polypyramis BW_CC]